jgi:hypothetical protein
LRHNKPKQDKGKNLHKLEDKCLKRGMHGHWFHTCCTLKHLTVLYQASLKQNTFETNFVHKNDLEGHNVYLNVNAYLDVFDLFENPDRTNNMFNSGILEDN